jgi:hypothetical protein
MIYPPQPTMSSTLKRADKCPEILPPADETPVPAVRVAGTAGEFRLVAARPIARGDVLFQIEGVRTRRPTRYSVQIGARLHIDLDPGHSAEEIMSRYYWRFMNHACEPSAWIRDQEVIALHGIRPGDDVTFDYNSTEYEMAEPFACRCGSRHCLGEIRGFKHLAPARRELLRPYLAPHLVRYLEPTLDSSVEPDGVPVPA